MNSCLFAWYLVFSLLLRSVGMAVEALELNSSNEGSGSVSTKPMFNVTTDTSFNFDFTFSDEHTTDKVGEDVTIPMLGIAFGLLGFFAVSALAIVICLCVKYNCWVPYLPLDDAVADPDAETEDDPTADLEPLDASTPAPGPPSKPADGALASDSSGTSKPTTSTPTETEKAAKVEGETASDVASPAAPAPVQPSEAAADPDSKPSGPVTDSASDQPSTKPDPAPAMDDATAPKDTTVNV